MSWNPFRVPSRSGAEWFSVGPASAFPDLDDDGAVSQSKIPICGAADDDNVSGNGNAKPGCKVFYVPREDSRQRVEISITSDQDQSPEVDLTDQVLVFRFRGKIHAVDHQCPHSSYPLSKGTPFDIEDFGIVLSAGLTCPKHGWSFDLFSGRSDRGSYKLKVWEVQLRDAKGVVIDKAGGRGEEDVEEEGVEVWVRRKPRMG